MVDHSGGALAFFVAGPENECVDEFIDRLQRHTCAQYLGGGRSWHRLVIEWPAGVRGLEFFKTFLRRLAKELDRPSDANEAAIADALSKIGKPAAVLSFMVASEWQADEDRRIGDWLEPGTGLLHSRSVFRPCPCCV